VASESYSRGCDMKSASPQRHSSCWLAPAFEAVFTHNDGPAFNLCPTFALSPRALPGPVIGDMRRSGE
jgi:hypothetical protein